MIKHYIFRVFLQKYGFQTATFWLVYVFLEQGLYGGRCKLYSVQVGAIIREKGDYFAVCVLADSMVKTVYYHFSIPISQVCSTVQILFLCCLPTQLPTVAKVDTIMIYQSPLSNESLVCSELHNMYFMQKDRHWRSREMSRRLLLQRPFLFPKHRFCEPQITKINTEIQSKTTWLQF